MGDTIDDAMEEEGSAADEDMIVGSVLAEIGINLGGEVPEAPSNMTNVNTTTVPVHSEPALTEPMGATSSSSSSGGGGNNPTSGGGDSGFNELEARLNNLRRT